MNPPTKPNQTAFPDSGGRAGLTKREYFAALAMQGMLANPVTIESFTEAYDQGVGPMADILAAEAVAQADALIDALNAEG